MDEAVNAAFEAQKKVAAMSFDDRKRMIDIIVRICNDRREELGRMEMEETKVGRLDHKILKLTNMRFVLGVEEMRSEARSDPTGLCIIEHAPWGVIGMMLPVTHSVPTMASNAINILAAGNTAVFGPHPSGQKVARYALQLWNREIEREMGVANVVTTVGGQTGLNLAVELAEAGILEQYGVELIGAKIDAIKKAEDRLLFKDAMRKIGLETPESQLVNGLEAGTSSPRGSAFRASCGPVSRWAAPAAASHTTRKRPIILPFRCLTPCCETIFPPLF